jgi:hypothetical protein
MKICSPFNYRLRIARFVFWILLLLLVNGWIDYANQSLRNNNWALQYDSISIDDYDTIYEWVAEELFDVENAVPEQKGDTDDPGKVVDLKIISMALHLGTDFLFTIKINQEPILYTIAQCKNPSFSIWVPPPNSHGSM